MGAGSLTSGGLEEDGRMVQKGQAFRSLMKGVYVSGSGAASYFTELEWVKKGCLRTFGFIPYPGTFNVEVVCGTKVLNDLRNGCETEFIPPQGSGFHPAKAARVCVNGVEGIAVFPASEVNVHGCNVLEVMCSVCLREALGVREGDGIEVSVL